MKKTIMDLQQYKNHSQNNEQEIIFDYFGDFVGAFLDVGANDGRTLSNTLALIEKGWSGDLIEPSPKAFERLITEHDGNIRLALHNVAIATYDGEIEFNESGELLGQGDVGLVSSVKQEEMDRWKPMNMQFEKMKVPCRTFKTFMKGSMYKQYDFLSLDIEGMELEVLPQIDFSELGIRLACIEYNGKGKEKYEEIMKGFKIIHQNAENLIFAE